MTELSENVLATVAACDGPLMGVLILLAWTRPPVWYVALILVACGIAVGWVYQWVRNECARDDKDEHAQIGGRRD